MSTAPSDYPRLYAWARRLVHHASPQDKIDGDEMLRALKEIVNARADLASLQSAGIHYCTVHKSTTHTTSEPCECRFVSNRVVAELNRTNGDHDISGDFEPCVFVECLYRQPDSVRLSERDTQT